LNVFNNCPKREARTSETRELVVAGRIYSQGKICAGQGEGEGRTPAPIEFWRITLDDTDVDFLCNGLPAEEAKRLRKILAEWSDGDENGFPVQLVMLPRVQWRAAVLVPQAANESCKLIELHLAEHRRQTATLIGNLSVVVEEQTGKLKGIVKPHT
jgi:hypothetical protein